METSLLQTDTCSAKRTADENEQVILPNGKRLLLSRVKPLNRRPVDERTVRDAALVGAKRGYTVVGLVIGALLYLTRILGALSRTSISSTSV